MPPTARKNGGKNQPFYTIGGKHALPANCDKTISVRLRYCCGGGVVGGALVDGGRRGAVVSRNV
jgi:hypothetical protein